MDATDLPAVEALEREALLQRVAVQEQTVAALREERDRLAAAIAAPRRAEAELSRAEAALARAEAELARVAAEEERWRLTALATFDSISWRLTKPLRAAKRGLRRTPA